MQESTNCHSRVDRSPMVFDQHGEHGRALARHIFAQHHDVGMLSQDGQRILQIRLLTLADPRPAQLVLLMIGGSHVDMHVKGQATTDGSHDVRRAALLAVAQHLAVPRLKAGRKNYLCISLLT